MLTKIFENSCSKFHFISKLCCHNFSPISTCLQRYRISLLAQWKEKSLFILLFSLVLFPSRMINSQIYLERAIQTNIFLLLVPFIIWQFLGNHQNGSANQGNSSDMGRNRAIYRLHQGWINWKTYPSWMTAFRSTASLNSSTCTIDWKPVMETSSNGEMKSNTPLSSSTTKTRESGCPAEPRSCWVGCRQLKRWGRLTEFIQQERRR